MERVGPDDWMLWRDLRLRALADSPDAFASTLAREQSFSEDEWRARLVGSSYVGRLGVAPAAIGAGVRQAEDHLQVVAMWTAPEARGHGLGSAILTALVATAAEENRRLELDVAVDNEVARSLYERHGFVATGERQPLRAGSALEVEKMVSSLPG